MCKSIMYSGLAPTQSPPTIQAQHIPINGMRLQIPSRLPQTRIETTISAQQHG